MRNKLFDRMDRGLERFICNFDLGSDPPPAPNPNPGMIAAADTSEKVGMAQVQLGNDQLDFEKQQAANNNALSGKVIDQQMAISNANQQQANDYYNYQVNTFRPVEQNLVNQAINYNSAAHQNALATQAAGDVSQAYQNNMGAVNRQLTGMGVNPNSGRFLALNRQNSIGMAASQAGAMTNARNQAEALGVARMQDAASLGRNLASNAATAYGISLNGASGAMNSQLQTSATNTQGMNSAVNFMQAGNGALGNAGSIYGNAYNTQMGGYKAGLDYSSGVMQGWGQLAGAAIGAFA